MLRFSGPYVVVFVEYLISMEIRGQGTFITTSVIFVAIKLTGCDTNENWGENEGSENRVPAICNSVSVSNKLY